MSNTISLRVIGHVRCGHQSAAGTPIQTVYAENDEAWVELDPAYADGLLDIEGFDHLWLVTHLHASGSGPLQLVPFRDDRPHGVFATRSPQRPNPIGLSLVRLLDRAGARLRITGVDMLDGTPVLDIKPYIPAFDQRAGARAGWFDAARSDRQLADDRFDPVRDQERFDSQAADWDEDADRQRMAQTIATAIRAALPLRSDWRVLDFGCGTGLLGRHLADAVGRVHGIDTAAGMITAFRQATAGDPRFSAEQRDLLRNPVEETRFDAVVSSMTLHHITEIDALCQRLRQMLRPGGWLAIADLLTEDGRFHAADQAVAHHGFDPAELSVLLQRAGFAPSPASIAYRAERANRAEPYPIFLLVAQAV